ncbi:MAG: FtsX-like permease family protein [Phyllobacteriaceae bacterium]|nr:FtsX-like permease family protein [Phyllobacteriaceae bacterium]
MASGVMTIVLAVGAYRSLLETRETYYDRYGFAHVFASAMRAPNRLRDDVLAIPGVIAAELRVVENVIVSMPGMAEPASGRAVSIPDFSDPSVNRLYLRSGRMPDPARAGEIALDERFAKAHRLGVGDTFTAIMNGRERGLTVAAIVLSPEYIYALGPGDIMPDDRRFAVFFMPRSALEGLFDMGGAFNDIAIRLLRGASEQDVIDNVDRLLDPYGGAGAHPRIEQLSHAFLDSELSQLYAMARVMPPVFLFVSAFLVNMILSRLVALEREQIGLLKACGYTSLEVALHYARLVIVIVAIGLIVGSVVGDWLGQATTRLYSQYFSFPFLVFRRSGDLFAIAAIVSLASAFAGAFKAIRDAARLAPAVAMQPPAPARYRSLIGGGAARRFRAPPLLVMAFRHFVRRPLRSALTTLGLSMSVALLVTAMASLDEIDEMIDIVFSRTERADATLVFAGAKPPSVLDDARRLPGVLAVEGYRSLLVTLRNGARQKRAAITGRPRGADLSLMLDRNLKPLEAPDHGVALTERLARHLDVGVGDTVEIEVRAGKRRTVDVPVTAINKSFLGLSADMALSEIDRLAGDGPRVTSASLLIDATQAGRLYEKVKKTPSIAAITLQGISLVRFHETIAENITTMTVIYTALAVVIGFGVVYNSMRIQFSERARELASLRVLGFTRLEVAGVLFAEIALIVVLAQPVGWSVGALFAWSVSKGFESDLFTIPFVMHPPTFAYASIVAVASAAATGLIVKRRVDRLDMVRGLKTRE